MEMTGERRLPAPRARVWEALNDPAILRASIPGCRTLEPDGENGFKATAGVKVGPISTSFTGQVRLLDLVAPVSYRIEGSGNGGPAGVAKGGANVRLTEENGQTILSYSVTAEVGGKLAQLGARLIDATARQMADQFFDNFAAAVAVPAEAPPEAQPPAVRLVLGFPVIAWVSAAVFLFIAAALFG
jgi:carbon monoxide dehydrogenase subunit G